MQLKKKLRKDMRIKERRRKGKKNVKKNKNERMSNVTEIFANKLKIKKKDGLYIDGFNDYTYFNCINIIFFKCYKFKGLYNLCYILLSYQLKVFKTY